MENRVVSSEESVAEQGYTRERVAAEREQENESIRRLLATKTGREYVLRQLKRAFPLGGGSLCSSEQGTFYNLGKFESYLEILLDLREAFWEHRGEGRRCVGDILLGWFFDEGVSGAVSEDKLPEKK